MGDKTHNKSIHATGEGVAPRIQNRPARDLRVIWNCVVRQEKQIRKAVFKKGGTLFDLRAAVILYRVNGFENAMQYVDGIPHNKSLNRTGKKVYTPTVALLARRLAQALGRRKES